MGLIWDGLIALDMLFVSRLMAAECAITSFLLTVYPVLVYQNVLKSGEGGALKTLSLATGAGAGSFLLVKYYSSLF